MNKRTNEYEVIFSQIKDNKGEEVNKEPIRFPFQNHDDVYKILDILLEKKLFEEENQTAQFAIGLKLLGDVIMKNKDKELFSEIQPAFVAFMKKLKGKG